MNINNLPEKTNTYTVARYADDEYWFYMSFADAEKAYACAYEIGGYVFTDADMNGAE